MNRHFIASFPFIGKHPKGQQGQQVKQVLSRHCLKMGFSSLIPNKNFTCNDRENDKPCINQWFSGLIINIAKENPKEKSSFFGGVFSQEPAQLS